MSSDEKILILIRHAHRDTSDKDKDNGLSEKGKQQALQLFESLKKLHLLDNAFLLSSPKKRCIETLSPIANYIRKKVIIDPLLVEQQEQEKPSQMKTRIRSFFKNWVESPNLLTLACSHGDWLPYAIETATHAHSEFEKSGWAELVLIDKKMTIRFRNG